MWCLTRNFEKALASVTQFIKEYSKTRNLEINRLADLKRDYQNKVDVDDLNYKAVSDLFVEIVICYYSYFGFDKYKRKFKRIFEEFQNIFSSYVKDIINNEFSESRTILEVIKSSLTRLLATLQPAAQVEHQRPPLRPADVLPHHELQNQVHQ